jgi:Xaa-Pro aminopeptidase
MDRTLNRRQELARTLENDHADAILVLSVPNVRYLTGFTGDSSALVLTAERAILVSDGRYTTQIAEECRGLEVHIRPVGTMLIEAIADTVGTLGLRTLAFESAMLSVADLEDLKGRLPGLAMVGVKGRVEVLRAVKDEDEIAAIRTSIGIAERAFAMLREGLRLGETEKEVADALEGHLRRSGAECAAFPPIVAVGERAALPHASPSATSRIGEADFVLVDWGANGSPYRSDLTRVLVTGKVTSKFETLYRTVLAAQERGIAAIRPGALAQDVDAEARSVIEDAGFGPCFSHGLGHGLGMEIHEAPWFRKGSQTVLKAGMVVTVEPGIYLPGWGGIRIEDDVLVTADGHEVLTQVPRSLDSVRVV